MDRPLLRAPRSGASHASRAGHVWSRIALGLVLVLVATGLRVGSRPSAGWADTATAVTLDPVADATVAAATPTTNYGSDGHLKSDGKPQLQSVLRFTVPAGAAGPAVLRLWVTDSTSNGPAVRRTDVSFVESAVTWATRPTVFRGPAVDASALKAGGWAEWDVSGLVTGPGDVTLALVPDGTDGAIFASRESKHSPHLVFGGSVPTSSSTTTTTTTAPPPPPTTTTVPPTTTTTVPPTTTSSSTTTTTGRGTAPACLPDWGPASTIGSLEHGIGEMSAFVSSPNHPGWGWGIRDSGNAPSLWAIKPNGDVAQTVEFRAYELYNHDWEDMAWTPGFKAGTGLLWVLDNVGNTWTGNRWIYQFDEQDPLNPPPAPPLPPPASLVGAYQWAYPDEQVNTETMFAFDGDLAVVSKTTPARVYRFDGPLLPFTVNVPTYVGTLATSNVPSIAALSVDQRTLAIANHGKVDVYENRHDVHDLAALIANPVFHETLPADNREGGAFFPYGSCDMVLVAESKTLWRVPHR